MMKLIRGEIITAESKKVKLSDEHIKKLLEKGKQKYAFEIMQLAKEISE